MKTRYTRTFRVVRTERPCFADSHHILPSAERESRIAALREIVGARLQAIASAPGANSVDKRIAAEHATTTLRTSICTHCGAEFEVATSVRIAQAFCPLHRYIAKGRKQKSALE